MRAFLDSARSALSRPPSSLHKLHITLGNEACDADSIVSAVCYSFLKASVASVASASSCWSYAPLIACARHDLSLRCETMKLLDKAGVSPDVLTCVDEFDPVAASQTAASDCFRITLVDHNALAPHLKTAAPNVTEIVDHHKDMGLHADVTGRARNVSFDESLGRGVGSTCTLVAEAFLADAPSFLHADVALMLLGVILVDTLNLDPTMNKTTPRDEAAVSALLPVVRSAFPTLSTADLYAELQSAKTSTAFWKSLSTPQLLAFDYKMFPVEVNRPGVASAVCGGEGMVCTANIATCAVLFPLSDFLASDVHSLARMREFCIAKGADLLLVLTLYQAPDCTPPVGRQVLVYARSDSDATGVSAPALFTAVHDCIASNSSLSAEEFHVPSEPPHLVAAFNQRNVTMGRKQVVPIISGLLSL